MSKISAMMDVGKRSLSNSGTALQVVGHNIANKSTEGYSRQRVDLQTAEPITEGRIQIGMGARAGQVSRTNNPWLEKQIQKEGTNLGYQESRADALGRVENVYNEQVNKGLNQYMTDFFNSFRELSNNPESLASRTNVREAATALTNDFKRVIGQLRDVQQDVDGQIRTNVEEINQFAREIASLNEKIQLVENQGAHANDERDRRDVLLKKLGDKIDISWAEGSNGMVNITAGRTAVLVSGGSANELKAGASDTTDRLEVYFQNNDNGSLHHMTEQITGGRLGGIIDVRDNVIEGLIDGVDKMAYTLAKEVNEAHIQGFDRYGKQGVLFFDMPAEQAGAAETMALNMTIFNDVGRIAAGAHQGAPGDNTVANIVSTLQYQKVMDGGATLDDFYNTQVGQIGTVAQRAVKTAESQKNIVGQLNNIRESVSGVSLDEETTKMIEFQRAYDASARLIRTADEMLETVLNIKR